MTSTPNWAGPLKKSRKTQPPDYHLQAIQDFFALCQQHADSVHEPRCFRIGTQLMQLRFVGATDNIIYTRSIAHLEYKPASKPHHDCTIYLIDATQTGLGFPADLLAQLLHKPTQRYYLNFYLNHNSLYLIDYLEKKIIVWEKDMEALPTWRKSYPFRQVWHHWFGDSPVQLVHSAGVGFKQGGVLLTGQGGSGKSTSTVACLNSPLQIAGDDFVMVDAQTLQANSLYGVTNLMASQFELFPYLWHYVVNKHELPNEKGQVYLQEHFSEKLIERFPIKAIVMPRFMGEQHTNFKIAKQAEAYKAILVWTVEVLGPYPIILKKTAELVRQLPCYWLDTGTDLQQIPAKIMEILAIHGVHPD